MRCARLADGTGPLYPRDETPAMTEIINLRQARKRRERAEKERRAAENRRRFGRKKTEVRQEDSERDNAERDWRGHEIDPDD